MPSSNFKNSFSAIVLAGGHSRRMGSDKALLLWENKTIIEHLVAQLQQLSDNILVITGSEIRYRDLLGVPVFADELKDRGPLGGLYTGLKHARHEYSLVVACDMPLVSRALIELLSHEIDGKVWAIVPQVAGQRIPTMAIYHKSCLSPIKQLLATERSSLQALLDIIPIKIISEGALRAIDPTLRALSNINSLDDWRRLAKQ